jgi:hypothetical protein
MIFFFFFFFFLIKTGLAGGGTSSGTYHMHGAGYGVPTGGYGYGYVRSYFGFYCGLAAYAWVVIVSMSIKCIFFGGTAKA